MLKRLGLMAAGVAVGIVVTGILLEQERLKEENDGQEPGKKGLFAEVNGNTVRMYEVVDGRFCGYTETKVFENQAQAMEWVIKETDAKIVISGSESPE